MVDVFVYNYIIERISNICTFCYNYYRIINVENEIRKSLIVQWTTR